MAARYSGGRDTTELFLSLLRVALGFRVRRTDDPE